MAETLYIVGAGINRSVKDWHGLRPPLATDFFAQALRHPRIGDSHYLSAVAPVFEYIARYWHRTVDDLRDGTFDLEECFTLLQLKIEDARVAGNRQGHMALAETMYRLTQMLAEFLSEFEVFSFSSGALRALGRLVHSEQSPVLTFNYDTLLESAIELASRVSGRVLPEGVLRPHVPQIPVTQDHLAYSHFNWNRPLGYGVQFDEVRLQHAGIPPVVPGRDFYSAPGNDLYAAPLLKLHGSLNWFVRTGLRRYSNTPDAPPVRPGRTILYQGRWWNNELPDVDGELIEPLIVTPVLYKRVDASPVIQGVWRRARDELRSCRRLVIAGYSFPPTDFHTRRLLLETFCDISLDELVVVNPDASVMQVAKRLCNFKKPVRACRDLKEFLGDLCDEDVDFRGR